MRHISKQKLLTKGQPLSLPDSLDRHLTLALKPFHQAISDSHWLAAFRAAIRSGYTPKYYSETEVTAFNYLYFGANYFKAIKAIAALHPIPSTPAPSLRILDLGCGAGAASAALLHSFSQSDLHQFDSVELFGVDISERQLTLYNQIVPQLAKSLKNTTIHSINADALTFLNDTHNHWNIILCSYLIQEQPTAMQTRLLHRLNTIGRNPNTKIIIIGGTTREQNHGAHLIDTQTSVRFRTETVRFHRLHTLSRHTCPQFCSHTRSHEVPHRKDSIARRYFECWETHDIAALKRLFHPNAIYAIGNDTTLTGIEEIAAYWRANKRTQRNVRFTIHSAFRHGSDLFIHWDSTFHRVDLNALMHLRGTMWFEIKHGRIIALRELYSKYLFTDPLDEEYLIAA